MSSRSGTAAVRIRGGRGLSYIILQNVKLKYNSEKAHITAVMPPIRPSTFTAGIACLSECPPQAQRSDMTAAHITVQRLKNSPSLRNVLSLAAYITLSARGYSETLTYPPKVIYTAAVIRTAAASIAAIPPNAPLRVRFPIPPHITHRQVQPAAPMGNNPPNPLCRESFGTVTLVQSKARISFHAPRRNMTDRTQSINKSTVLIRQTVSTPV